MLTMYGFLVIYRNHHCYSMENHTIAENILGAKSKTFGGHLDVNATSLEEVDQSVDSTGNHIDTNHQNESEDKLISEDPKDENSENSKFDEDELLKDEDEVDKGKHINCVSISEIRAADGATSVNDRLSNSARTANDTLDSEEDFHSATEQTDVTTDNEDRLLADDETVANISHVSDSDLGNVTAVDRQISDTNTNKETAECSKTVMETGVESPRNITDDSLYEATATNQLPEATPSSEKPTCLEVEQPMDVDSDNSGSATVSNIDVSNDDVTTINQCEANERLRSTNGDLKESRANRVAEKRPSELNNTSDEISKESEGNDGREPESTGDVTSKEFETVPDVGKTAENSCNCTRTEVESTCDDSSKDMESTGENVGEGGARSSGGDASTDVAEDAQKGRRTEVLHIDQNEDDAEIVLDTGEKDPFGQENEVGTGDVEPTPSNDKETVEAEPMDVDQSVDLDENETSQNTNSKSTSIKDLPDSGKTAEEVGDENCIIPDSVVNDEAAKNGLDVSKQIIRKFDITPVRLEKLMDPTKLANSKVQSTDPDRNTGVGARPQRRAAIKAESQIKVIDLNLTSVTSSVLSETRKLYLGYCSILCQ